MANTTDKEIKLWALLDEKRFLVPSWVWLKWEGCFSGGLKAMEEIVDKDPETPLTEIDCLRIQDKVFELSGFI